MVLMRHSLLPVLYHKLPVLLAAAGPECLPESDHHQEHGGTGHADESGRDEAVLVSEVVDPRGDSEIQSVSIPPPQTKEPRTHSQWQTTWCFAPR